MDKVCKIAHVCCVAMMTGAAVLSTSGCARVYHAVHYNCIARTMHEHPRSYFHSEDTGRIIPKDDCYCPVELPCYGYEPTCWQPWPAECPNCPVAEEVCIGDVMIDQYHQPVMPNTSPVVSEPTPAMPDANLPTNSLQPTGPNAPPVPDSTQTENTPPVTDSTWIDTFDNNASEPVPSNDEAALSIDPTTELAQPLASLPQPAMPVEVDAEAVEQSREQSETIQPAEPAAVTAFRSSRRKHRLTTVGNSIPVIQPQPTARRQTSEDESAHSVASAHAPQAPDRVVAEISNPGDPSWNWFNTLVDTSAETLAGGMVTKVPSFKIAVRMPNLDSTDATGRIKRVTDPSLRFVSETESVIRVSDANAKLGETSVRFR